MWTNVFRIGELNKISWFQFLPCESDPTTLTDKRFKAEKKDATTQPVISAHLSLQNKGFLTAWTNSFVGPWDPSQGVHNPDEKIKLWLFLPGHHISIVDDVKAPLSALKGGGSGIWSAPGDSEEVAVALSLALKNRIERTLRGFSYMRYGDVFMKTHPFPTVEKNSRIVKPSLEFVFSASKEAIYVHAIISSKNVRGVSVTDLEKVLDHSSSHTTQVLPVIVAANGMRGQLTGSCPSDLVKQVFSSNSSSSTVALGVPSLFPSCQMQKGQNSYAEVTLGCPDSSERALQSNSIPHETISYHQMEKGGSVAEENNAENQGSFDNFPNLKKTFIFPAETVLVPNLSKVFVKSSLKRIWLSASSLTANESSHSCSTYSSSFITHCLGFGSDGGMDIVDALMVDYNYKHLNKNSSTSRSISSTSSTSSDSDDAVAVGDLDADADSFNSRQSGLCSNDQRENDLSKEEYKRSLTGITESSNQSGIITSGLFQDQFKSSDMCGSFWDLSDGCNNNVIDIDDLISEFGGFTDFFQDDPLDFGEPPGTAESQAHVVSVADHGDVSDNLFAGSSNASDQTSLPGSVLPSFEEFNQYPAAVSNSFHTTYTDTTNEPSAFSGHSTVLSSHKYDYMIKAEANITLTSEYSAVEVPRNEFSTSIFRSPYLPKSKRVETPNFFSYIYSSSPPSSNLVSSEGRPEQRVSSKSAIGEHGINFLHLVKYYSHVEGRKNNIGQNSLLLDEMISHKNDLLPSIYGNILSSSSKNSSDKNTENCLEGHVLVSKRTVLATEHECIVFQAAMCRLRHILLNCSNQFPMEIAISSSRRVSNQVLDDTSLTSNMLSNQFALKKKDSIPVRIAGDMDVILDRPVAAPVGIWRTVGAPKSVKSTSKMNNASFSNSTFIEEDLPRNVPTQSLKELVDAVALIVQQSTSFVDISLDTHDEDGPYNWLALQEQIRRGFACGPSNLHAGCGGLLASCHSVDIAGVDLMNPISNDVHATTVAGLLVSDVKVALKAAFQNLDGPLSLVDWCSGHRRLGEALNTGNVYSAGSNTIEPNDSSSTTTFAGEPISPPAAIAGGISSYKDGGRIDDSFHRKANYETDQQMCGPPFRPTISLLPLPALLVGYQDDWLRTSAQSLQLWEKAPFEPYAQPKPITYYAVCPDIDILTSATEDFLQQLGTVYEACKLGSHTPHFSGNQMDQSSIKGNSSGIIPVECPPVMKTGVACMSGSGIGTVSEYLQSCKSWNLKSFLTSLSGVLKAIKFGSNAGANQKDGSNVACMAVYVICPFPETTAVLQTLVESCSSLGSAAYAAEKGRSLLHSQVAKALSCATATDEASVTNIVMLTGFSMPKLVLQIVSVDLLLRFNKPSNDLAILKDLAFTVYNKARRIVRSLSNNDTSQSLSSGRSESTLMHVNLPSHGLWKESIAPRISVPGITGDGQLDSTLRPGAWDNSWQTLRTGGLNSDPNRSPDICFKDDLRCMFEPLFILAESGSIEHGMPLNGLNNSTPDSSDSRFSVNDGSNGYTQASISGGASDINTGTRDGPEHELKVPSLHCCYGWTEDWRWLISIWTDSKGELLDSQIFPFGGISSRQDTKVLQCLFVQLLHQGCQILSSSPDSGTIRSRDIIITRIGYFFELECQEWQKAIYSVGGNEVEKWPLQLRRFASGLSSSSMNASLQQQDISIIQERTIPSPPLSSIYNPNAKSSNYMKGAIGQTNMKKTLPSSQNMDGSHGFSQFVRSISLIGISVDHSMQLVLPGDSSLSGGVTQSSRSAIPSSYLDGFSPVKSLGAITSTYVFTPYPSLKYLPPVPLQLPTCLTSESPPLAHLLHSKGSAIPLSTGYIVSKAVPSIRKDHSGHISQEWPSVLSVNLVDHYAGNVHNYQEKSASHVGGSSGNCLKQVKNSEVNSRDYEMDKHIILQSISAELHSLSWMTVSPIYPERRTVLPFHCDMLMRLRRLLHFADKELSRSHTDK